MRLPLYRTLAGESFPRGFIGIAELTRKNPLRLSENWSKDKISSDIAPDYLRLRGNISSGPDLAVFDLIDTEMLYLNDYCHDLMDVNHSCYTRDFGPCSIDNADLSGNGSEQNDYIGVREIMLPIYRDLYTPSNALIMIQAFFEKSLYLISLSLNEDQRDSSYYTVPNSDLTIKRDNEKKSIDVILNILASSFPYIELNDELRRMLDIVENIKHKLLMNDLEGIKNQLSLINFRDFFLHISSFFYELEKQVAEGLTYEPTSPKDNVIQFENKDGEDWKRELIRTINIEIDNYTTIEEFFDTTIKKAKIYWFLKKRNINHLIHFTDMRNIASISQHGLLSKKELIENAIPYHDNDRSRLDNYLDGICLSITEINTHLIKSFARRERHKKWAVIYIKPEVLFKNKCLFYNYNAATSKFKYKSEEELSSFEALEGMFSESVNGINGRIHERSKKENNQTTAQQAEVILSGKVRREDILDWKEWLNDEDIILF
mgnify:FL=1